MVCYYSNIHYRVNSQITAKELRVLDEKGDNLDVLSREAALRLAEERHVDLIEIAPNANPPVARLMSFDKFRYLREKAEKKQRHLQKTKEMKHVRISPRAAQNDLQIKASKADDFLKEGHGVEISLFLRGREKGNRDWNLKKLNEFLTMVKVPHHVTLTPKFVGKGFIVQIAKK
ncbi:translation initiation factor IF-3 [Candidatus Jorgensenbacteria bacterium]|nr:translation initiation factor IF-3 [Candidatus Jorgensenbacteria bacterium]